MSNYVIIFERLIGVLVYEFIRSPKNNSTKSPWAVKMVNTRIKNRVFTNRLRTEAELLRKMNNPHIVGFRQFTKNIDGKECLVMEECTTSLDSLIEERFNEENLAFPPDRILKVALDISKAMAYIHGTILLLHGDIKSHNVLIQDNFKICKLCDFGVSLPLTASGELNVSKSNAEDDYQGSLCWCSAEVLKNPPIITDKADIFAFGLVLWEMMALDVPHANTDENCDVLNLNDSEFSDEPYGKFLIHTIFILSFNSN